MRISDCNFAQNDTAAGIEFSAITGQTGRVHVGGQWRDRKCGVTVINYATAGAFQVRDLSKDDIVVGT